MQKLKSFSYRQKGFLKVTARPKGPVKLRQSKKKTKKNSKKQRRQLPGLENQVWQVKESFMVYQLSLSSCLLMTDNSANRQSQTYILTTKKRREEEK